MKKDAASRVGQHTLLTWSGSLFTVMTPLPDATGSSTLTFGNALCFPFSAAVGPGRSPKEEIGRREGGGTFVSRGCKTCRCMLVGFGDGGTGDNLVGRKEAGRCSCRSTLAGRVVGAGEGEGLRFLDSETKTGISS